MKINSLIANKSIKKGFTLIEIMVAVVVIATLTASMMPRFIEMKKEGEASDEYAKVTELRSRLVNLYDGDLDFDGVADSWKDQLPSSFKMSGDKVYSTWKNEVVVEQEDNGFYIEYLKVPKGGSCTGFAKAARDAGWAEIRIDSNIVLAETTTAQIAEWCKANTAKEVVASYKFVHKTI